MDDFFNDNNNENDDESALSANEVRRIELARIGVPESFIMSYEQIETKHQQMLRGFSDYGVKKKLWDFMKKCGLGICGRPEKCSFACWHGKRLEVQDLMIRANDLLELEVVPQYMVTIIDPRDWRPPGELKSFGLLPMKQRIRRRIAGVEEVHGKTFVCGGAEASFDIEQDGSSGWSPHFHGGVATRCPKDELADRLCPTGRMPRGFSPVMIKPITNRGNALIYSTSSEPDMRTWKEGKRGEANRHSVPMPPSERRTEYDRWIRNVGSDRLILRNLKRTPGGLVVTQPQKRRR